MDDEEAKTLIAVTEAHTQAMRDSVPEGPGLVLNEREALAVALMVDNFAKYEREDILGAIMKTSGHTLLSDAELCDLGQRIEDAANRAKMARELAQEVLKARVKLSKASC